MYTNLLYDGSNDPNVLEFVDFKHKINPKKLLMSVDWESIPNAFGFLLRNEHMLSSPLEKLPKYLLEQIYEDVDNERMNARFWDKPKNRLRALDKIQIRIVNILALK